jgi:hypothetical protein
MPFYPDEGRGDDIEIENKYDLNANGVEKSDDDSDSFLIKSNKKKKDLVSGIDHEELKKRIEDFALDNNPSTSLESSEEEEIITEDEEGVPSIKDFETNKVSENKNISGEENLVYPEEKKLKYVKKKKQVSNETLNWYMRISGVPIFLITLYSLLVLGRGYLVTISSNLTSFAQSMYWFDNLKWPFEILVFLVVTYIIIKREEQLPRIAGITCVVIGFSAGVIIAVVKLFWYREMWNIFYLSAESIFLGITGLVVGLLSAALFYEEYE